MKTYKIIIVVYSVLNLLSFSAKGQVKTFEQAKNEVFGNLDISKINTGILYNAGFFNNEFKKFNGKENITDANFKIWLQCYGQLYNSFMINPKIPKPKELAEKFYKIKSDNTVYIGLINFNYNIIKDNALNDNLIIFRNNKLYDSFKTESPYKTENLFVAAPLIDSCFTIDGQITFQLDKQFFFTNIKNNINKIEIDFQDGSGYRKVDFGEEIFVNYETFGTKNIKIKFYASNRAYYCSSDMIIYTNKNTKSGDVGTYKKPDDTYSNITGIDIGIWYACENHQILKPIIFVEGFDPMNNKDLDSEKNKKNLWAVTSTSENILETLQEKGYDIFIIDFNDNATDLTQSAMMVVNAVNYINSIKQSNEELIIGGRSGGGLLARYALAYMEEHNMEHHTKLLLSIDSENQGANISLGFQHFVKDVLLEPRVNNILGTYFLSPYFNKTLNSPYARQILYYHCTATDADNNKAYPTQEHIDFYHSLNNLNNGIGYPTKVKRVAISNAGKNGQRQGVDYSQVLDDLQFPLNTQCQGYKISAVAYALPDYNQNSLIYDLSFKIRFLIVGCLFTSWVTIYSDKIHVDNTIPYDDATGSYLAFHRFNQDWLNFINYLPDITIASQHECFVPVSSSLDLDNDILPVSHGGVYCSVVNDVLNKPNIISLSDNMYLNLQPFTVTPFDIFLVDNSNNEHITSSSNWTSLINNQVSPENVFLQNQVINYNQNFYAKNNLIAGRNVTSTIPQGDFVIKSNKKVVFTSGNRIVLKPGFRAEYGAEFTAKIINTPNCTKKVSDFQTDNNYDNNDSEKESELKYSELTNVIQETEKPISVYPNPAKDKFYIIFNFEQKTPVEINIYDFEGRHIFSDKTNSRIISVNTENFHAGIYIVKLNVNNRIYTEKIIIQN